MAAVKFDKGSEEWLMFVEFWNMCQEFWKPEESMEYWQRIVTATDNFYEKFKHLHLAKELAVAFGNAQDKKFAENRK